MSGLFWLFFVVFRGHWNGPADLGLGDTSRKHHSEQWRPWPPPPTHPTGPCHAHRWLAPLRRQLSTTVLAGFQRSPQAADRATLPEALRSSNLLTLSLEGPMAVSGLRLWNYNKTAADTARGVKRMVVFAGEGCRDSRQGTQPLCSAHLSRRIGAVAALACEPRCLHQRHQQTAKTWMLCPLCRRCRGVAPRGLLGAASPRHCCPRVWPSPAA